MQYRSVEQCIKHRRSLNEHRVRDFEGFIRILPISNINEGLMRGILSIYCGLLLLLCMYMYKRASLKQSRIKRRDVDIPHAELDTYSPISFYILVTCKLQLITMMALSIFNITLINLPKFEQPEQFQNLMLYFYRSVVEILYFWLIQLFLLMTAEFYVMRSVILFERSQPIESLTFVYNNTNMHKKRERKV